MTDPSSPTLKPSPDSDIKVEVWLPLGAAWNGKYEAVGGGGWAGVISYPVLASAVQEGYATSSTDTGHEGGNAKFAVEHPEKIVDFSYRAVHEMVVKSKAVITAFYGRGPRLSYWNGCSTGGRQGLMEAQRYPEDFDGIVAGAPANFQTHLHAFDIVVQTAVRQPGAAVPPAKVALVGKNGLEVEGLRVVVGRRRRIGMIDNRLHRLGVVVHCHGLGLLVHHLRLRRVAVGWLQAAVWRRRRRVVTSSAT